MLPRRGRVRNICRTPPIIYVTIIEKDEAIIALLDRHIDVGPAALKDEVGAIDEDRIGRTRPVSREALNLKLDFDRLFGGCDLRYLAYLNAIEG